MPTTCCTCRRRCRCCSRCCRWCRSSCSRITSRCRAAATSTSLAISRRASPSSDAANSGRNGMKTALHADLAPAAVGPYSHAQVVRLHGGQRLVFTSGQVGLDPASGKLVDGDVAAQTEQVFKNLSAVLRAAGLALADIVKTTVYLADMQ